MEIKDLFKEHFYKTFIQNTISGFFLHDLKPGFNL